MEDKGNVLFLLIPVMFGVALGSLLIGFVLKLSVYTYNLMAGGPKSPSALPVRS